tara:strand:+ start:414 stop:692 length:279 start_codon:yes stop_codon:yes gene_type:complete
MKNNLDFILFNHEMKKDFNIFEYNETQRTSTTYENYIYQAIYGFEIDEIIKPKIKALKGDKEKMKKLYKGIEKLLLNNELSNTEWKKELKKL